MTESRLLIIYLIEILHLIEMLLWFFETNINIFYIPHMILNVVLVLTFLITNLAKIIIINNYLN